MNFVQGAHPPITDMWDDGTVRRKMQSQTQRAQILELERGLLIDVPNPILDLIVKLDLDALVRFLGKEAPSLVKSGIVGVFGRVGLEHLGHLEAPGTEGAHSLKSDLGPFYRVVTGEDAIESCIEPRLTRDFLPVCPNLFDEDLPGFVSALSRGS